YFDADEKLRFRDLDVIADGPVVDATSKAFDAYWNSDSAYPVTAFASTNAIEEDLAHTRITLYHEARAFAQSEYAAALPSDFPRTAATDRKGEWFWGKAILLADSPEKVTPGNDDEALRMQPEIDALINGARQSVLMISAYFVPGTKGT